MPISIPEAVVAVLVPSALSVLAFRFLRARWRPLLILVAFWTTGIIVGPVTNHTFIQLGDLLDTTELHHDQIVALLGILGVIGAVWAEIRLRRSSHRAHVAPLAGAGQQT